MLAYKCIKGEELSASNEVYRTMRWFKVTSSSSQKGCRLRRKQAKINLMVLYQNFGFHIYSHSIQTRSIFADFIYFKIEKMHFSAQIYS